MPVPVALGIWEPVIPAVAGVLGVSLAGYLVHLFTRRRTAEARYDDAITAVARLQAERHTGSIGVPGHVVKASGSELAKIEQDLSVEGVRRFLDARADARAALAALYAYSPDLRLYWDKTEIPEGELDELTQLLMERRRRPTKVHDPGPSGASQNTPRGLEAGVGRFRESGGFVVFATATAGLLGAMIGGVFSYLSVMRAEDARTDRQVKQERNLARGAARLLVNEYYSSGIYLQTILDSGVTLPVDEKFKISLSAEDARRIASGLTARDWNQVALANGLIDQTIVILHEIERRERTKGAAPLRAIDVRVLRETLTEIEKARRALRSLAAE